MKYLLFSLLVVSLIIIADTSIAQVSTSYNDVLIMINDSSVNSVDIGNYFVQRRHIPAKNVFHFQHDTSKSGDYGETIDSLPFKKEILWPLQTYMRANNLVDSINYIVSTKGCPLRVTAPANDWNKYTFSAQSSFTDCIALANGQDSVLMLTNKNIYSLSRYASDVAVHFQHDQNSMPYYLTTRLDGYTVDQIKAYILKAETPAFYGQGLFVLDEDPGRNNASYAEGNDWLAWANDSLKAYGCTTLLDTTNVYLTKQSNVIGYCSWGSNDGNSGTYATNAKPQNTYLNGAIAETYVSTGGRSFNVGTGYGQSLIADWVAEGVSGVKGYTDEPYLSVMAEPHLLFSRYVQGFNMAECYWSSSPFIAWRQVVIGDPKMSLRMPVTASVSEFDFGNRERYVTNSLPVTLKNVSTSTISFKGYTITGGDSTSFSASSGSVFPLTVPTQGTFALNVSFQAKDYATYGSTIQIKYTVQGNSHTQVISLPLSGVGVRPTLAVPDTVHFQDVRVHDTAVANVTVRNTAALDTIVITGATSTKSTSFLPQVTLPLKVYPGDSVVVPVRFSPQDTGIVTGTLNIKSTATLFTKTIPIPLIGRGVTPSGIISRTALPASMTLSEGYPNPSSERASFNIAVSTPNATLKLYDVMGRLIADASAQLHEAGAITVQFDISALPEGVYFCRLSQNGSTLSRTIEHTAR